MSFRVRRTGIAAVMALAALALASAGCGQAGLVVGTRERVKLLTPVGEIEVVAKIDTGADSSSIDEGLARQLGLTARPATVRIVSADGREERLVGDLTFKLGDRKITSPVTFASRSHLSTPMLIGRKDLRGFLVDPSRDFLAATPDR